MPRRSRSKDRLDLGDVLALFAGALFGIAAGVLAGGAIGRVNAHRVKGAVRRWSERPRPAVWTAEEAERLEARVLDALARDVVLARRPIRVAVLGKGLVELSGRVLHTSEIGLAGDAAGRVRGAETVLNHLLVEGTGAGTGSGGPRTPRAARS